LWQTPDCRLCIRIRGMDSTAIDWALYTWATASVALGFVAILSLLIS